MKKKLTALLMALVTVLSLAVPAGAAPEQGALFDGAENQEVLVQSDLELLEARLNGEEVPASQTNEEPVLQQDAIAFLLKSAGLKESQLGTFPQDYLAMAESLAMTDGLTLEPEAPCTIGQFKILLDNTQPLYDAMNAEVKEQLFVNGLAQPIFEYSDPTQPNGDSGVIRFCVYVETNYDTDDDGKLDLVKALVQLPRETLNGMKVPVIYEARPYITGCVNEIPYGEEGYDISKLYAQPAARVPAGTSTTAEAVAAADPEDWNYLSPDEGIMDYEDLTWYDYYLVRGFGVVECGGLGTLGSEGFETCGADVEIDAFACVLEWMAGERTAYTDRTGNIAIEAEWYNGSAGMTGRSYAGTTTFGLATVAPVGLKTIVPVAGIASWYEYTNSQGAYTRGPAYTDSLASYCAGRYLDQEDYASIADKYGNYLYQQYLDQKEANGDYNFHWENRDYTRNAHQIGIPALIVHGLNDWNVRTKEFDLMYEAFQTAGQDAKLLLHQGAHVTPTQPATRYPDDDGSESTGHAILVDGVAYDEILNMWFSHYLCGVDNGAEDMATVTVQSNVDGSWTTYDTWDEDTESLILNSGSTDKIVLSSDYLQVEGVEEKEYWGGTYLSGWKDAFMKSSTPASLLLSVDIPEDLTLSGAVEVHFTASNDAFEQGIEDPVMMSAMLFDIAPEEFTIYNGSRKDVMLEEEGVWAGGGLKNFDLVEFRTEEALYKTVTKGWMDLCNPAAGYASSTACKDESYVPGESYDYTLYLQPNLYTFQKGHKLAVALFSYDPDLMDYDAFYNVTLDGAKTYVSLPVRENVLEPEEPSAPPSKPASKTYDVQIGSMVNGTVSADTDTARSGRKVTLTPAPADGFVLQELTVENENGRNLSLKAENGGYSFFMPSSDVTVHAVFVPVISFADVPADAYYQPAVQWAVENGITSGLTADTFAPGAACTRAQAVTFLWRAAGSPAPASHANPFTDVAEGSYCSDAVLWAVENGITNGVTGTVFAPDAVCTRAQIVTFLYRAAGSKVSETAGTFSDIPADAYYAEAVQWAVESGVTAGKTAVSFAPGELCTRAQIVTFLYRACAK